MLIKHHVHKEGLLEEDVWRTRMFMLVKIEEEKGMKRRKDKAKTLVEILPSATENLLPKFSVTDSASEQPSDFGFNVKRWM